VLRVTVMDQRGLHTCREEWNRLVLSTNRPSIFCTWEWVSAWLEQYGGTYAPLLLLIHQGRELKGILPLAAHTTTGSPLPLMHNRLSYCGSREVYPDHVGLISSAEDAPTCLDAVMHFLSTEYTEWDAIEISLLSDTGHLAAASKNHAPITVEITQRSVAPFISFPSTIGAYTATLSGNFRYNLQRRERQLLKERGVVYATCRPADASEGLRTLLHLHQLRAEKKNILSTFQGESIFNFHRAFIEKAARHGWIWLRFLKHQGETIAAFYGFSFGRRLFYYQLGLEPAWERFSPGVVLIHEVIKEAFATGHTEFDFLRGNEAYKTQWTRDQRALFNMTIYNNTLRGNVLKAVSFSRDFVKRAIKMRPDKSASMAQEAMAS